MNNSSFTNFLETLCDDDDDNNENIWLISGLPLAMVKGRNSVLNISVNVRSKKFASSLVALRRMKLNRMAMNREPPVIEMPRIAFSLDIIPGSRTDLDGFTGLCATETSL